MTQRVTRVSSTIALGCAFAILSAGSPLSAADDKSDKSPAGTGTGSLSNSSDKPPDFSHYVFAGKVVGTIVKTDDKSLTFRITWFVPQSQGNRRPNLYHSGHSHGNPYAANRGRPNTRITLKEVHHDYTVEYLPESQVRTKTLAPKYDDNGKKADYTTKEIQELRGKWEAPGYLASAADLVPGTIVEVTTLHAKGISEDKVTDSDLRVKFAVILGKDPNPPKVTTPPTKADPKKKN